MTFIIVIELVAISFKIYVVEIVWLKVRDSATTRLFFVLKYILSPLFRQVPVFCYAWKHKFYSWRIYMCDHKHFKLLGNISGPLTVFFILGSTRLSQFYCQTQCGDSSSLLKSKLEMQQTSWWLLCLRNNYPKLVKFHLQTVDTRKSQNTCYYWNILRIEVILTLDNEPILIISVFYNHQQT